MSTDPSHPDLPHWDERYVQNNTPWDTGRPSQELLAALDDGQVTAGIAVELGCGTGTNSVFLASRGFQVTGVDLSPVAIQRARQRAQQAGVQVEFVQADVAQFSIAGQPADFVFDRGCYHCVRMAALPDYLAAIERVTRAGSKLLLLCGNANGPREKGPPTVTEQQLRDELGSLFEIQAIRSFNFEDPDGAVGPLGWSLLAVRK